MTKRKRNPWKFSALDFPKSEQLSLCGLEAYYQFNYDAARAYVIHLAHKRLRAISRKQPDRLSLSWNDATDIADRELLSVLHCYGRVQVCREAPPYVVYVR